MAVYEVYVTGDAGGWSVVILDRFNILRPAGNDTAAGACIKGNMVEQRCSTRLCPVLDSFRFSNGGFGGSDLNLSWDKIIDIPPWEYKIAPYTDDMVFFLQDPLESMMELQRMLGLFSEVLGYKVNNQKSIYYGL